MKYALIMLLMCLHLTRLNAHKMLLRLVKISDVISDNHLYNIFYEDVISVASQRKRGGKREKTTVSSHQDLRNSTLIFHFFPFFIVNTCNLSYTGLFSTSGPSFQTLLRQNDGIQTINGKCRSTTTQWTVLTLKVHSMAFDPNYETLDQYRRVFEVNLYSTLIPCYFLRL